MRFIVRAPWRLLTLGFRPGHEVRVPISIAAGPLRSLVVPMSHQQHVERTRSRSRPCASTTGI